MLDIPTDSAESQLQDTFNQRVALALSELEGIIGVGNGNLVAKIAKLEKEIVILQRKVSREELISTRLDAQVEYLRDTLYGGAGATSINALGFYLNKFKRSLFPS